MNNFKKLVALGAMLGTFSGVYASEDKDLSGENPHFPLEYKDLFEEARAKRILFVDENCHVTSAGEEDILNLPCHSETLQAFPYTGSERCSTSRSIRQDIIMGGMFVFVDERVAPFYVGMDARDYNVRQYKGSISPFAPLELRSDPKVLVFDEEKGVSLLEEALASGKKTLPLDEAYNSLFSDALSCHETLFPLNLQVETVEDGEIRAPKGEDTLSVEGRILKAGNKCVQRIGRKYVRAVPPRLKLTGKKINVRALMQGEYIILDGGDDLDIAIIIQALDPNQPVFVEGSVDFEKNLCDLNVYRSKKTGMPEIARTSTEYLSLNPDRPMSYTRQVS